jgi:hypothetical protein
VAKTAAETTAEQVAKTVAEDAAKTAGEDAARTAGEGAARTAGEGAGKVAADAGKMAGVGAAKSGEMAGVGAGKIVAEGAGQAGADAGKTAAKAVGRAADDATAQAGEAGGMVKPPPDPPARPPIPPAPENLSFEQLLSKYADNAKIKNVASLEKLLDDAKIADRGELLALLNDAKIADTEQLVRLMERYQSGAQLRELLALPAFADGAALEHLADVLARAGWPEATRAGELATAKLAQLADPAILAEIEATLAAQEAGQIAGMRDWLLFNDRKAPAELAEAAAELRDARQLANDNPGHVVRVGREQNAPLRPGTTDERLPEFDLAVETPGGAVTAVVEVTSVDGRVSQVSDLSNGVRHAADKVAERLGTPNPVQGSPQALIHMVLDVGRKQLRGTIREILPDGTVNILRNDGTLVKSSNLFDDLAGNLAVLKNNTLLDRVTLVDQTGRRIVYVRRGSTWTRL